MISSSHLRGIILVFSSCYAFISCTTTRPAFPKRYVGKTSDKSPSTPLAKQGIKDQKTPSDIAKKPTSPYELELLYTRLISPNYRINPDDLQSMSNMPRPPRENSLAEAVLSLGNLKFIQELTSRPIEYNQDGTAISNSAIQDQFAATEMDLLEVLENNPHMQGINVFRIIGLSLRHSTDNANYREKLISAITQKSSKWSQLLDEFNQISPGPKPNISLSGRSSDEVNPSEYQAGDLLLGDTILLQAKKLAEKGEFKTAISHAQRIKDRDPYFPAAQEKIKNFSNLAVQELRQKAAQAFQSSLPVADSQTKAAYLEEAKTYLEEALSMFPAADHLTTVQENLAVITRDLETLEQETSSQ